ncbi:hypothetical protein HYFRA_00014037 [Hymenoscyphus fraxineus]|uniref:Ankyrin repeat protein n=1 Tax=Hymenoscyphus fraxineus TaxID=746836 RepID=A0A9N9LB72_9HELO|nr:hypothetical protein HYFRA_00014037 [Hymenoscyphus fraxineus]
MKSINTADLQCLVIEQLVLLNVNDIRGPLKLRLVNHFWNENITKSMIALSDEASLRPFTRPGRKCVKGLYERKTLEKIRKGEQWVWRVLLGNVVDGFLARLVATQGDVHDDDPKGEVMEMKMKAEREKIQKVICRLMTDLEIDWFKLDERAQSVGNQAPRDQEEDDKDCDTSKLIVAMASQSYEDFFQEMLSQVNNQGGLDINFETSAFGTALCAATTLEREDLVEALLEKGADPSKEPEHSCTAREEAAAQRNMDILRLLYDRKFPAVDEEFNNKARECMSEYQVANAAAYSRRYFSKVVKFLFKVHEKIEHEYVCEFMSDVELMHRACEHGDDELVEMFIEQGADVDELVIWQNSQRETLVVKAARLGHLGIVRTALMAFDEFDGYGGNAFKVAAEENHFDIVFYMLDGYEQRPPDCVDEYSPDTLCQYVNLDQAYDGAVLNRNTEAARTLWRDHDQYKDTRDKRFYYCPYSRAIEMGHGEMIELFVKEVGMDVDEYPRKKGRDGESVANTKTPLIEALSARKMESIETLLKLGARPVDFGDEDVRERIRIERMTPETERALEICAKWDDSLAEEKLAELKKVLGLE